MDINIKTKLSVGDEVYLVTMDYNAHAIDHNIPESENHFESKNVVVKTKVSNVRVNYFGKTAYCISYFFKGMTCYEGENWFDEQQCSEEGCNYLDTCWFHTKAMADEFCMLSNKLDSFGEENSESDFNRIYEKMNEVLKQNDEFIKEENK